MLIPLIDFLASKNMHTKEELENSKLSVLNKTNMVDFAMDIYKELNKTKEVPKEMSARRDEVLKTMQTLREDAAPLLEIVSDAGRVAELKAERCFNQAYLQQQLNITPSEVRDHALAGTNQRQARLRRRGNRREHSAEAQRVRTRGSHRGRPSISSVGTPSRVEEGARTGGASLAPHRRHGVVSAAAGTQTQRQRRRRRRRYQSEPHRSH